MGRQRLGKQLIVKSLGTAGKDVIRAVRSAAYTLRPLVSQRQPDHRGLEGQDIGDKMHMGRFIEPVEEYF